MLYSRTFVKKNRKKKFTKSRIPYFSDVCLRVSLEFVCPNYRLACRLLTGLNLSFTVSSGIPFILVYQYTVHTGIPVYRSYWYTGLPLILAYQYTIHTGHWYTIIPFILVTQYTGIPFILVYRYTVLVPFILVLNIKILFFKQFGKRYSRINPPIIAVYAGRSGKTFIKQLWEP